MRDKGKNYELNPVTMISSIKELLSLAEKEAGDELAFQYKNKNKVVKVTYKEFVNDTKQLGTALTNINMRR